MKLTKLLLMLTVLASCGQKESVSVINGKDGSSCRTEQLENGSKLVCEDGSFSYVYNGRNGAAGINGLNGINCSVEENEFGALISCADNSSAQIYNGTEGTSCSVEDTNSGAEVTCEDGSFASIQNGTDNEGCEVSHSPNNGGQGNKYTIDCGETSITFTAKAN